MRRKGVGMQEDRAAVLAVLRDLRLPYAVYVPVVLLLLGAAATRGAAGTALGLALVGVLLWTLLEYLFHRFVLHMLPRGGARRLLAGRHLLHHKNPTGHPGIVLLWVSALNGSLFLGALTLAFGPQAAASVMSGTIAGYLAYESLHLWAHVERDPKTRLGRLLRQHHLIHHRRSARTNFAIILPVWDVVFATAYRRKAPAAREKP